MCRSVGAACKSGRENWEFLPEINKETPLHDELQGRAPQRRGCMEICGLARFNVQSQNLDKIKRAEALVPDGAVPDPMINPKAGVTK